VFSIQGPVPSAVSSGEQRRKHVFQAGKTCQAARLCGRAKRRRHTSETAPLSARGVAMSEEASFELGIWGNCKVRVEMPRPAIPISSHLVKLELPLLLLNALRLRP
jgi:hypothetical protein